MRRALVLLMLLVPAADAGAATVSAETVRTEGYKGTDLSYVRVVVAGGAEADDIVAERLPDGALRIRDRGAPLHPGAGCATEDEHTAVCRSTDRYALEALRIEGGPGDDRLSTGTAPDLMASVDGGDGSDTLVNETGRQLYGWLTGGAGDDVLIGGAGEDWMDGGAGADRLEGGDGPDRLAGGDGSDTLLGGAGDDDLAGDGGTPARDQLDGGEGTDTADYAAHRVAITIDLRAPTGGEDALVNVESAVGGHARDVLIGDDGPNSLTGGPLHARTGDVLRGGAGNDALTGRAGADLLVAGPGDDGIDGGGGADRLDGGTGDDRINVTGYSERPAPGRRVGCGPGDDSVMFAAPRELVPRDCETIWFEDVSVRVNGFTRASVRHESLSTSRACRVHVQVETAGGRVLSRAATPRPYIRRPASGRFRFTPAGRALRARPGRQRVRLRVLQQPDCRGRLYSSGTITTTL